MKFWKIAALVALATIPLLILGRKKAQEKELQPEVGDSSNIFEQELSLD